MIRCIDRINQQVFVILLLKQTLIKHNDRHALTGNRGGGQGDSERVLLLVVVPLDDVVALRDAGLAVSLVTLAVQEFGPPEQLLLVERELPHP
jgi:hypothetical protein